jgi:hypothetical protein
MSSVDVAQTLGPPTLLPDAWIYPAHSTTVWFDDGRRVTCVRGDVRAGRLRLTDGDALVSRTNRQSLRDLLGVPLEDRDGALVYVRGLNRLVLTFQNDELATADLCANGAAPP